MADFQDLFSNHAACYAQARPRYPAELFAYLAGLVPHHCMAWDCGTGNGQAAVGLVEHFKQVIATDGSAGQIAHATPHERIEFRVALAEETKLAPGSVDLITVAQALHWLPHDAFYANVRRVAAPHAVIAAWCYTLPRVNDAIDAVCDRCCYDVVGPYWESGRRWVEERYETIPFPFREIRNAPVLACRASWTLAEYMSYVESWSAVQRFKKERGRDPLAGISSEFAAAWGEPLRRYPVTFPIHMRVGSVHKAA